MNCLMNLNVMPLPRSALDIDFDVANVSVCSGSGVSQWTGPAHVVETGVLAVSSPNGVAGQNRRCHVDRQTERPLFDLRPGKHTQHFDSFALWCIDRLMDGPETSTLPPTLFKHGKSFMQLNVVWENGCSITSRWAGGTFDEYYFNSLHVMKPRAPLVSGKPKSSRCLSLARS